MIVRNDEGIGPSNCDEEKEIVMLGDISTVCLTCKVLGDPVLNRTAKNKVPVVDLKVSYVDDHGKENRIGVKAWGKLAEMVEKVLEDSMSITVVGNLTQEKWRNKTDNMPRSKMIISAINISVPLIIAEKVVEAEDAVFDDE